VFYVLGSSFQNVVHPTVQFIKEIKDALIYNPSYTVDEFLLLCRDEQLRNRRGVRID
jgi:hypothetical protein